ncbi:MAG: RnfH family protein [Glaciimonas sp.]|nr:RnfH family protein [Glaciimonas sp.]
MITTIPDTDIAEGSVDSSVQSIRIQVCYGISTRQLIRMLIVPHGSSLHDAIIRSGLLEECAEIDLNCCRVGIFGKLKTLETAVRDADRIEIYRGLIADPMESRRKRASKIAVEEARLTTIDKKFR